jgi:hypothetical protein
VGGLGPELEARRRAPDAVGIEERRFEEDLRGGLGHLGVAPSHHAAHGDGSPGIGDHGDLRVQPPLPAVERDERLARRGPADANPAARDPGEVEGVGRRAELEEHPVRGVHDVEDRADAEHPQPLPHGQRTRPRANALDHAARVERAALDVLQEDADGGLRIGHGDAFLPARTRRHRERLRLGQPQIPSRARGELPRHPDVALPVGAVGRHVEHEDGVVEAQEGRDGIAGRRVGRLELEDAPRLAQVREAELRRRAQHPVRPHAADLARLELRAVRKPRAGKREGVERSGLHDGRAADDGADAVAVGDRADLQPVGARMRLDPLDAADEHSPEAAVGALDLVHEHAQARQALGGLLRGEVQPGQELAEPAVRDAHGVLSALRRTA